MRVVLPLIVFLGGCYLSHEQSARVDASPDASSDAGPQDSEVFDGVVPSDAAVMASRCTLIPQGELGAGVDPQGNLRAPDLFWTGEQLGVVFSEDHAGSPTNEHGVVSMVWMSPDLTNVSERQTIGENSHGWGEAAWNGEGFGVCWSGDPRGPATTNFREVLDGRLGPRTGFGRGHSACLDLAFGHGRYAATWRFVYRDETEDTTLVDTHFQVVERDGVRVGDPVILSTAEYGGYAATLTVTERGFLAVSGVGEGIRFVELNPEGQVLADRMFPLEGARYTAFARRGTDVGLLTLSGDRETRRLVFRVLDSELRERLQRVILDGAPTASSPRVLARDEGWLLVWGEGSRPSYRAMMLSLDPEGMPLSARRVLYDGFHSGYGGPSMLNALGDVFIALSHEQEGAPPLSREYTFVQRWSCEGPAEDLCAAQDARIPGNGDCERGVLLGWRFDGAACVPLYDCDAGCEGEDCPALASSRFACESDRRECLSGRSCTTESPAGQVCGPTTLAPWSSTWLDVEYGGDDPCPCERPVCTVEPAGTFELAARLTYCVDEVPDCDCPAPIERPTVACPLPPLVPGEWTLRFTGRSPVTVLVERDPAHAISCR